MFPVISVHTLSKRKLGWLRPDLFLLVSVGGNAPKPMLNKTKTRVSNPSRARRKLNHAQATQNCQPRQSQWAARYQLFLLSTKNQFCPLLLRALHTHPHTQTHTHTRTLTLRSFWAKAAMWCKDPIQNPLLRHLKRYRQLLLGGCNSFSIQSN